MDRLDQLESESIYIFREAFNRIENIAMLWSLGKDSNVMIWLARKAFFGHVPFPVMHVDTGKKFPEMYAFREQYADEWNLNFLREECPPIEEVDQSLPPAARSAARKTAGLKLALEKYKFNALFAGIRGEAGQWDFRDQPPEFWNQYKTEFPEGTHIRVHPLLHWTEVDIWHYTAREGIPVIPLYFAKEGKRYRSLGDQDITHPVPSTATTIEEIIEELNTTKIAERAGRAMDHEAEDAFERLRADGYL